MLRKKTLILSATLCCAFIAAFPHSAVALSSAFSDGNKLALQEEAMPPSPATPRKKVVTFGGVGTKTGAFDTGFRREKIEAKKTLDEEKPEGIQLSPGLQKIVDDADQAIKDLDEATLNAVSAPLKALGLEAESAQLRPAHGGVNLGISIKLDKQKKSAHKKEKSALYDLAVPQGPRQTKDPY
ncbi:MAG: hypothetical protein ACOYD9_02780 [Pyramidobacter sp.]|jgi:hypothetical protein